MAEIKNNSDPNDSVVTITVKEYESIQSKMKKYFGTTDSYSIYVAAAEQEYGSGKKKPSTQANKNIANG